MSSSYLAWGVFHTSVQSSRCTYAQASRYTFGMVDHSLAGPRGGRTTRSKSGLVRKSFWIDSEVEDVLRRMAFEERRSESEIVREILRRHFGVED